jgi:hypothetical protein
VGELSHTNARPDTRATSSKRMPVMIGPESKAQVRAAQASSDFIGIGTKFGRVHRHTWMTA